MNIYLENDYRKTLKQCVQERKNVDPEFSFQKLAGAMRIQGPYLSKVLSGSADLNEDQMYLGCEHLQMNDEQIEYMLLLLARSRTTLRQRKEAFSERISAIQEKHRDTRAYLTSSPAPTLPSFQEYYLDPFNQIVHIALLVERYNNDLNLLANRLRSTLERVASAIHRLEQLGLIERKGNKITVIRDDLHLPSDSPIYPFWRSQIRQLSLSRMQIAPSRRDHCFSVTFSADRKTRDRILEGFLALLKQSESWVKNSKSEEVFQMNFDLFAWTQE
jgi:uncharacterized protein (TIGR02147 family)